MQVEQFLSFPQIEQQNKLTAIPKETQSQPKNGLLSKIQIIKDDDLSSESIALIKELKQTQEKVKQHEQAHIAAGGQYVQGGPTFHYTKGPDGETYIDGGTVNIDTSSENTPEETIKKAEVVRRAALAPANPSSQDQVVAAKATQLEAQARMEILHEKKQEADDNPYMAGGTATSTLTFYA